MAIDISSVAYAITHHPNAARRIKHGHAQQCLAAALGYKSLATLQASHDATFLPDRQTHVVLDAAALLVRAQELSMVVGREELVVMVREAISKAWVGTPVHTSLEAFRDALQEDVNLTVALASGQTITNSNDMREIDMSIEGLNFEDVPSNGNPHEMEISGHITMRQDPERPYRGHHLDVHATLWLVRQGRAFWAADCRVKDAEPGTSWNEPDVVTLAEALADMLGVDIEAAEELADSPLLELASDDGLVCGWEFDFSETSVTEEVLEQIKSRHGSLRVKVGPSFFDPVQEFERDPRRYYLHGDEIEDEPGMYFCASCDLPVEADHFDHKHATKPYERYFADLRRWQRWPARNKGRVRRPANPVNFVAAAALAHQAAYEASRCPFHRWLGQQLQRNDAVGDLARDVRGDKSFPVSASREALLRYLGAVARTPDVVTAFEDAWREFNSTK